MPTPTPPSSDSKLRLSHVEALVREHDNKIRGLEIDGAIQEERGRNIENDMEEIKNKTENLSKELAKTRQDVISSNIKIAIMLGLGLAAANLVVTILITKILGAL